MAKFNIPVSEQQFLASLTEAAKKELMKILGCDERFLYSCFKLGWTNKQFHKDKQDRDREDLRLVKEAIKKDPKLAEKIGIKNSDRGI